MGRFQVIYADPPWSYKDRGCNGAAEPHYKTMSVTDICKLPVEKLAAPDAVLFMWATYPMMPEALATISAWGFKYKSIAFQWLKLRGAAACPACNGPLPKPFLGLGRWTRGNSEPCLLATRGKPSRLANDVSQLILTQLELVIAPVTRHSAKPPEVRDRIVRLMGDVPRVELFAREHTPGWYAMGNQLPRYVPIPDSTVAP